MSGSAVDKVELNGPLNNLSPQIIKVKRTKKSKSNLLDLKRLNDNPNNLEIWKAL